MRNNKIFFIGQLIRNIYAEKTRRACAGFGLAWWDYYDTINEIKNAQTVKQARGSYLAIKKAIESGAALDD